MHNGLFKTLEEVINFFIQGGEVQTILFCNRLI
jgi:hypothetical protein